ncbi:MAG: hypothetical protein PHE54_04930, partial [Bacilli bacterium]|nr:hypothetical protein [Bacilli bacterium]
NAGNVVKIRTNVIKFDNISPTLTVPANMTIATYDVNDVNLLSRVSATDNSGQSPTITVSGSLSAIAGTYTITYKAADEAGNVSTKTRIITVIQLQYTDDVLNGADPELASNMIPIVRNSANTKWLKADVNSEWYNYSNQWWANAVTVTSVTLSAYQNAAPGTEIKEDDILTYWVWIPRYKYRITSGSSEGIIDIVFENSSTTLSSGNATNTYLTHPAFIFGSSQKNGFWMAKFELSGTKSSITIKPNLESLTNVSVSDFFKNIQKMETRSNYNFDSSEVDIHMIKNSEWGAAAYLKQSIYGLGMTDIGINNNKSEITGCGAAAGSGATSSCNTYETSTGRLASTTGNIYGVYDMSGGNREYVMGNYSKYTGYSLSDNSGYSGLTGSDSSYYIGTSYPNSKYYNEFTNSNLNKATTSCNNGICYGQALSETFEWYNDQAEMVSNYYPWLVRGGWYDRGSSAGVFAYYMWTGDSETFITSRATLMIE